MAAYVHYGGVGGAGRAAGERFRSRRRKGVRDSVLNDQGEQVGRQGHDLTPSAPA